MTANYRSAEKSLPYFDRAVEGFGRAAADEPGDNYLTAKASQSYRGRAAAQARLGRLDEARRDAEAGLVVRRAMASRHPARGAYRLQVGSDLAGLSRIVRLAGGKADALAAAIEAVELHRPLVDTWPHENQVLFQSGQALLALAGALLDEGRTAEAAGHAGRAAELLDRMIPEDSLDFLPLARAGPARHARRPRARAAQRRAGGGLRCTPRRGDEGPEVGRRAGLPQRRNPRSPNPTSNRSEPSRSYGILRLDLDFPADPFAR